MENQFLALQNWTFEIFNAIKKELKSDHLGSDPGFYRTHFGSRPQSRLTIEEIFAAYEKELMRGNADLAEWVVNRWVFKHGDLYQHFADRLSQLNPDFGQIQTLSEAESEQILAGAVESFGAIPTFLFVLLNGVVFPHTVRERLRREAEKEREKREKEQEEEAGRESLEKVIASQKREIARLQEKIAGVQKKYDRDIEGLKKQIANLQKKLHG